MGLFSLSMRIKNTFFHRLSFQLRLQEPVDIQKQSIAVDDHYPMRLTSEPIKHLRKKSNSLPQHAIEATSTSNSPDILYGQHNECSLKRRNHIRRTKKMPIRV